MISMLYHVPIIGGIFRKLINQKESTSKASYSKRDLLKVILTTLAVLLFSYNPNAMNFSSKSNSMRTLIGLGLLLLSLLCDGLLCLKEKIINGVVHSDEKYEGYDKVLSWEYMMIYSYFSLVFCFGGIIYGVMFNNLSQDLFAYLSCVELVKDLIIYSLVNSFGQVIIFIFLEKYGPLALSMITSVRKILTIALSIIMFGKKIMIHQCASLILATVVILWEVMDKQKHKAKIN